MIKQPTTLILGAGANKDYGFPLGKELVDQIIEKLGNPKPNGIYKILADLGHKDPNEIGKFVTNLKGSNLDSIDEFISKQPEFNELAKKCIAIILIPYENSKILEEEGWYRFFINRLFEGIKKHQFRFNDISIITFNYDRSLEFYLRKSFRCAFDVDESEAENILGVMDIVHVYGKLARLGGTGNDARPYDSTLDPELVVRAARQIVTVPELDRRKYDDIADILEKQQRVYFFGFGYSDLNLQIMKFNKLSFPQVIGSSVGLGEAQKKAISAIWNIEFPGHSKTILEFIKDYAPLD